MAWFIKASVFNSVNSAPSANGGLNPAWVWYIDRSEVELFVPIQIAGRHGQQCLYDMGLCILQETN